MAIGWPLRVLLAVAGLEVVINRVAAEMLKTSGLPSVVISYLGLFLFYFTGTLAAVLIGLRCYRLLAARRDKRDVLAHVLVALTAGIAAAQLVVAVPDSMWLGLALDLGLAASLLALVATIYGRDRDVGIAVGLPLVVVPLLVHVVGAIGGQYAWTSNPFEGPSVTIAHLGIGALCIAALASPYCFAPRPFARAVTRPAPVLIAMGCAAAGALLTRLAYPEVTHAASLAFGVDLSQGQADPRLALYLLAFATLAWTIVSCLLAASPARRLVGAGFALVVLGGYQFHWPNHYLLPLLGVALIAEAARTVREEELAALPLSVDTPAISDVAWSAYISSVATGLRRTLTNVHSVSTRDPGSVAGLTATVIVGDSGGLQVRTRIERIEGSVVGLDVLVGHDIPEVKGATFTLWAIAGRGVRPNLPAPEAAPPFKTGDAELDARFRARGSQPALERVLDAPLRARVVATLDGWLAYWEPEALRYRVYPSRGAPLDHPIPLSELAAGRGTPTGERLVSVIELITEIGARAVKLEAPVEPTALDVVAEAP